METSITWKSCQPRDDHALARSFPEHTRILCIDAPLDFSGETPPQEDLNDYRYADLVLVMKPGDLCDIVKDRRGKYATASQSAGDHVGDRGDTVRWRPVA